MVSQANLDGTGGVSLGTLNGTLNGPTGIAIYQPVIPPKILVEIGAYVQILFGITNDGGGIEILPGGGIIHIPPSGPPDPIFLTLRENMPQVLRAVKLYEGTAAPPIATTSDTIQQERRQAILLAIDALWKMWLSLGKALLTVR